MKRKRRGFTLVELLVVIAIIALLMGILMPALAKVRQIAYRMVCGTNLGGIGKAMLIYANDYDEDYPVAGYKKSKWATDGRIKNWLADTRIDAFTKGRATITSCLFTLVRHAETPVSQFVCKGDVGCTVFEPMDETNPKPPSNFQEESGWDFGKFPGRHCSYSYQIPFYPPIPGDPAFPVTSTSDPAAPLCADRNPYYDENANPDDGNPAGYLDGIDKEGDPSEWVDDPDTGEGYISDPDKTGNSACHQRDGQNVLFNDQHVGFMLLPNCGINNDNIWKYWTTEQATEPVDRELGDVGKYYPVGDWGPKDKTDAWLVNERQDVPGTGQ